uniref:Sm domain-containing protein n=1 Tax=Paramormyrops kingsleyae TaxID=1676925 RepID=A0A3B3RW03_9TELE
MASPKEENGTSLHTAQMEMSSLSTSPARQKLENLLNKSMRIRMTDGRTLVGLFLCTDRDCNVILGSAQEFLKSTGNCEWSVAEGLKPPPRHKDGAPSSHICHLFPFLPKHRGVRNQAGYSLFLFSTEIRNRIGPTSKINRSTKCVRCGSTSKRTKTTVQAVPRL